MYRCSVLVIPVNYHIFLDSINMLLRMTELLMSDDSLVYHGLCWYLSDTILKCLVILLCVISFCALEHMALYSRSTSSMADMPKQLNGNGGGSSSPCSSCDLGQSSPHLTILAAVSKLSEAYPYSVCISFDWEASCSSSSSPNITVSGYHNINC